MSRILLKSEKIETRENLETPVKKTKRRNLNCDFSDWCDLSDCFQVSAAKAKALDSKVFIRFFNSSL